MYDREEWFLIYFGSQNKHIGLPLFPDYLSVSCDYVTAHNNDSFESNKFVLNLNHSKKQQNFLNCSCRKFYIQKDKLESKVTRIL